MQSVPNGSFLPSPATTGGVNSEPLYHTVPEGLVSSNRGCFRQRHPNRYDNQETHVKLIDAEVLGGCDASCMFSDSIGERRICDGLKRIDTLPGPSLLGPSDIDGEATSILPIEAAKRLIRVGLATIVQGVDARPRKALDGSEWMGLAPLKLHQQRPAEGFKVQRIVGINLRHLEIRSRQEAKLLEPYHVSGAEPSVFGPSCRALDRAPILSL